MHDARTDQIDYHCVILIERSARLKIVFFTIDTYQSTYDNDHIIIVIIYCGAVVPSPFHIITHRRTTLGAITPATTAVT